MKTLLIFLYLVGITSMLSAQDAELKEYKDELSRAVKSKNKDSIAAAYCHLSEYYAYRSADTAKHYCNEGLKYADKDKEEPYMTLVINLATTYMDEGNISEGLQRYFWALKEANRVGCDVKSRSSILTSVGVAYRRKEMPDSAVVYFKEALALLDKAAPEAYDEKVHLLTSMAILYTNTSHLKEGEFYAQKAMEAAKVCEDMDMVLYAASTAGSILGLRGKYEEGTRMLHTALSKAREQRKPKFMLKSVTYLLNLFYRMNRNDSINYYAKEAEMLVADLPDNSMEVLGYYETLCQIYTKTERYRESLAIQQRLLNVKEANAQVSLDKLYLEMARNYKGLKDYSQAWQYYERAFDIADSLFAEKINSELSELSVKYETQEKELEIARLTQKHLEQRTKTMQWGIVAAIAVFALLLFALYYAFRRKRIRKEEELKLAKSYIDGLERERTRLAKDLHDGVCNDLLGIGMQMQCLPSPGDSQQEVLKMLEQVREDVRCISHELMPPKFQYATLAETVEAYVEKLAIPASMQLAFSEESEGMEWNKVPDQVAYEVYRILQEMLSNIQKHSGATEVYVSLSLKENLLTLQIVNNGKAYTEVGMLGNGIGLYTIRERVKAINGALTTDIKAGKQRFKLEISLNL